MTLKLILTRHAKSDWGNAGQPDFDRPLNKRGRASARVIGKWLAAQGHVPSEVVVSGAERTVETWQHMAPAFDPLPACRRERALYEASPDTILAVLRGAEAQSVMLIGHNPGIGAFADRIVITPPSHWRFEDYPTCATTVMVFARDAWSDVGWREAEVLDFTVPRELIED